jgi:hypothetical protein
MVNSIRDGSEEGIFTIFANYSLTAAYTGNNPGGMPAAKQKLP